MMTTLYPYLCALYLFFPLYLFAANDNILHSFEHSEGGGDQDMIIQEERDEQEFEITAVDDSRDWLKEYIDDVSYDVDGFFIDSFFGDDIINDDVAGSRAKLSFFTRREIGKPLEFKYGIDVRLELPNTNERFSLLVQSSEDEEAGQENIPLDINETAEYSTALRYMIKETEFWKVSFDNGIKWGVPPNPFSRLRFRRLTYSDTDHARFTQTFDWSADDGFGESTRFEINHPLNVERMIRFSGGASYLLADDFFELDYGVSLYHELNRKEVLAYYLRVSGENRRNMSFNNYGVGIRYRRMVYQDWVFAEITPELETANANNYDVTPILMFRFEALIGH
jgi:hypothetical protein